MYRFCLDDKKIFNVGLFLLSFISSIIISASILLLLPSGKIGTYNFWISIILSILIVIKFNPSMKKSEIIQVILLSLGLILLSILFSVIVFDGSWDGNTYHKSMIGLLEDGWNPNYLSFKEYVYATNILPIKEWPAWNDAYPKASEIFASVIYRLIGNIESGKSYNPIATLSLFCIAYVLQKESFGLRVWQSFFCALVLAINPIIIVQSQSFYNDAFLGTLLYIMVVAYVYITKEIQLFRKQCWFLVFLCISIGINIKFSGLLHFGIYSLVFFIYWIISYIKKMDMKKLYGVISFYVCSVIFGVMIVGSNSYVRNWIRYHNPFYSFLGEGSVEMIRASIASDYKETSNLKLFFISLLSKVNNSVDKKTSIKFPFTIAKGECTNSAYDIRFGGWGVLFSGVFIICIILFIFFLVKRNDTNYMALITFATLMPVLFIPGLFWARYFLQLFLIPWVIVVAISMRINQNIKENKKPVVYYLLFAFLIFILLLNSIPSLVTYTQRIKKSVNVNDELEQLKQITSDNDVEIAFHGVGFQGIIFNLKDKDIVNYRVNDELANEDYSISFNTFIIRYRIVK